MRDCKSDSGRRYTVAGTNTKHPIVLTAAAISLHRMAGLVTPLAINSRSDIRVETDK